MPDTTETPIPEAPATDNLSGGPGGQAEAAEPTAGTGQYEVIDEAYVERLRSQVTGSRQEFERLKQELEEAKRYNQQTMALLMQQRQQPQAPVQQEAPPAAQGMTADEFQIYQQAVIDGDVEKANAVFSAAMGRHGQSLTEKVKREVYQEIAQNLQASQQQQNAFAWMQEPDTAKILGDPNHPVRRAADQAYQRMASDGRYSAFMAVGVPTQNQFGQTVNFYPALYQYAFDHSKATLGGAPATPTDQFVDIASGGADGGTAPAKPAQIPAAFVAWARKMNEDPKELWEYAEEDVKNNFRKGLAKDPEATMREIREG